MQTIPYSTPEGIIELVRKDEHDAVVRELKKHLEDANRGAERNAHINRSFAGQINQLHSDIRELNERLTKQQAALSGRTVSCSNCNALAAENAEMREAINGVSKIIRSIELNDIFEETMRNHAVLALSKLQPYLK